MLTKSIVTAALMIAVTAASPFLANSAAQASPRMRIFDANSGKKLFDDGKLDGRACAVGRVASFDPFTGRFSTAPKVKCNF